MNKESIYILDNNDTQRVNLKNLLNDKYDIIGESNDGEIAFNQILKAIMI